MAHLIGIVSDTHENVAAIRIAVTLLEEKAPELVIHCGDIISPPVLQFFKPLPMRFIFGNNDGEQDGLRKTCEKLGFGAIDEVLELEIAGKKIVAYHGTSPSKLERLRAERQPDYLFTGHTHTLRDERIGSTRVINPGALSFAPRYTCAVLDPVSDVLEVIEVPDTADTRL